MVIQGFDNGKVYFSGNLKNVAITGVNEYVDIDLNVAGTDVMSHERFYPVAGKVLLADFGKLIDCYFESADFSTPGDVYTGNARNVRIYCRDKDTTAESSTTVWYSKNRVSTVSPEPGMIYSWYKSINTAIGREEYVPFFADAATTLHIGVAHVRNGVEKYTRKSVTLGGRTGMLAFRVSPAKIASLSGVSADAILYYDVTVTAGTGSTDRIRYYMDKHYYRNTSNFIYLNSFGLPETIAFTGLVEYNPELNGEIVSLMQEDMRMDPELSDVRTVNSGYLSIAKYKALTDMVTSADIRVYDTAGQRKIVVTDVDLLHRQSGSEKFSVTVTYRPAERGYMEFERIRNNRIGIFDRTFDYTFN